MTKIQEIELEIKDLERVDVVHVMDDDGLDEDFKLLLQSTYTANIYDPYLSSYDECFVSLDDYKRLMEITKSLIKRDKNEKD